MAYTQGEFAIIELVTTEALRNMKEPDGKILLGHSRFVAEILTVAVDNGLLRTDKVEEAGMVIYLPNIESAQALIDRYQPFWIRLFN